MTTMTKTMLRMLATLSLLALAGCGSGHKGGGDMGADGGAPACVMNPMTPVDILNGCTNAQTGDPAKDYPYFPAMAPNGTLPPLP